MSFTMHGVGVSGGIAIGRAHLVSHALLEVAHYLIPEDLVPNEVQRFQNAIATVKTDLESIRDQLTSNVPTELGSFINTHLMILSDRSLSIVPTEIIANELCNAEWALKQQMDSLVEQFDKIDDDYLRERKHDIVQVVERVIKVLLGHPSQVRVEEQENAIILVAHDLSPADTIQFKHHKFAAFITDVGGTTSHTAILARSLNIPSIVALQRARGLIRDGELVIVDGNQGVVIVNPDKDTLAEYHLRQEQFELEQQKLKRLKSTRAVTLDGTPIELLANIEVPSDVTKAKAAGATGVGLYRTEFLFMNRRDMPSEEEQFTAYRKVAESMKGLPVTIRTLDLGADKEMNPDTVRTCTNPALGLRAIRLCLADPPIFHTQLRALLRASHYGNIKILIPMLSNLTELRQSLQMVARAKLSLQDERIPFKKDVQIGGMIEIPAAAICADAFARELDFLSIGTNDLIQYTLAIDRTDDTVSHLYNPLHPAVLNLILNTIKAGQRTGKEVSICGEMAGDPAFTRLLLGLGLRNFSMHSAQILAVKNQVLKSDVPQLMIASRKIIAAQDIDKIEPLLQKLNLS